MKENKKAKKVVALLLCAVLLVVGSVTGTMAYLTSQATVTNTFTVGNVEITLDEAITSEYGVAQGGRTNTGNSYKLIPGHTYTKDPVIHVASGSEACYLFVKIENGISGIEGTSTIADQMAAKGWQKVTGEEYVWYHNAVANAGDNVEVFDNFTIKTDATVNSYASAQILITAYAVQEDGFSDANDAWSKTKSSF